MRDAKASIAASNLGQGGRLGSIRSAIAAPGVSDGSARSGAPAQIRTRLAARICAVLALCIGVGLLWAGSALADARIGIGSDTGVAVSEQSGDIYTLLTHRTDEYHSDGSFVRGFGVGVVPGAASGTGNVAVGGNTIGNVVATSGAFLRGEIITGPGIPANTTIIGVGGEEGTEGLPADELRLSNAAEASGTGVALTVAAGPGNVPTNEIQKVVVTATGGNFTLKFTSPKPSSTTKTTANIPYNASAGEVQAALEALTNIGAGGVSVTSATPGGEAGVPGGPYTIEFGGTRYPDTNVARLVSEAGSPALSGGTATVSNTEQGTEAVETCTTVCAYGDESEAEIPGQLRWPDALAIDNDSSSSSYGDVYVVDQT